MSMIKRFINLFRADRVTTEIDREMSFHVSERADELMAAGMPAEDALREAQRRFGNRVVLKERARDADLLTWLESLLSDMRYGTRSLLKSPVFAIVAVLSLALGIGANTAIFSLINAVMLKTLPVRHPEQLVQVTFGPEEDAGDVFTNPLWEAVRDRQKVFSGVFAYGDNTFNTAEGGEARPITGNMVSGQFFSTLGVRPALGRLLTDADDFRGCPGAAVLGYGMWQGQYGGDPGVIGRTISLNGERFPIIGVADKSFFGMDVGRSVQAYIPICAEAVISKQNSMLDRRSTWWLRVIGRPAEGQSVESARAALAQIAPSVYQATIPDQWRPEDKADYVTRTLYARTAANGMSYLRGQYTSALIALMVIVALVLVIACANVANLLLARSTVRQREVAVRLAIGAGRARVVRQLLTESLLLSAAGAAVGIVLAAWGSRMLVSLLSTSDDAVWVDLSIDPLVLGFTIAVATITGVLFGIAPAWQSSRVQPQAAMKANSRSVIEGSSRFNLGKALVVAQISLSLILVMGAALLLGSFRTLATMDPGFDRDNLLMATVNMRASNLPVARQRPMHQMLLDRARALPGAENAAISAISPMSGSSWNGVMVVEGFKPGTIEDALAMVNQVSDGYFATMGIPLVTGRDFDASDVPGSPLVTIVNEAFARHFFGTLDVLGRQVKSLGPAGIEPEYRIVGVVRDSKYNDLKSEMEPISYIAMNQDTAPGQQFNITLRAAGDPSALVPGVKSMTADVDPKASLELITMARRLDEALTRERILATLSSFFGGLALLLAMIGLYGIMSYNVARRRGEIGIRMALGSGRSNVMRMVLREVGGLVVMGVLLGGIGVFAGMKLISSLLFGLEATDPQVLLMSALTLSVVAVTAGAIPAWRAGRVDPMTALREE